MTEDGFLWPLMDDIVLNKKLSVLLPHSNLLHCRAVSLSYTLTLGRQFPQLLAREVNCYAHDHCDYAISMGVSGCVTSLYLKSSGRAPLKTVCQSCSILAAALHPLLPQVSFCLSWTLSATVVNAQLLSNACLVLCTYRVSLLHTIC